MTDSNQDVTNGMTDAEEKSFEKLLVQQTFNANQDLLKEGEPALGLIMIDEGRVAVTKRDMGGREQLLTNLKGPAIVGELELITAEPCAATVTAKEQVRATVLPTEVFERLLEQRDAAAIKLMRNLARALGKKLESTNEVYVDLAIWRR